MNIAGIILFLIFLIVILVIVSFFFIKYKPRIMSIPLKIFQTWHTKNLPDHMNEVSKSIAISNPEFKHYLFDENDCRNYIKEYYGDRVLDAYDTLIPRSYKSDLWRYCVLYREGGIYIDMKFKCYGRFRLIDFTDKEYFTRDYNPSNAYTGFIVCGPGCKALENCINRIVINVKNNYYGSSSLHPTGPALLAKQFSSHEISNFPLRLDIGDGGSQRIVKGDDIILMEYSDYRKEQDKETLPHYSKLWNENKIYKN